MDDERRIRIDEGIASGSIRPTYFMLSGSSFWAPWAVGGLRERVEIGLYREFDESPEAPPIFIDWINEAGRLKVDVAQTDGAADFIQYLPGLGRLLASAQDGRLATAEELVAELDRLGFAEATWMYREEDEGEPPLPPAEPCPSSIGFFGEPLGQPGEAEPAWFGPHIGRTWRLFRALQCFKDELQSRAVPVIDLDRPVAGPPWQLWEYVDLSEVDALSEGWRAKHGVDEAPYLVACSRQYVADGVAEAWKALERCGVSLPSGTETLLEPVSGVCFSINGLPEAQIALLEGSCQEAALRSGLVLDWGDELLVVELPDTGLYRRHGRVHF